MLWDLSSSLRRNWDETCVYVVACVPFALIGIPLKCGTETVREERILDLESNAEHQLLTAQAFQVPLLLKQRY